MTGTTIITDLDTLTVPEVMAKLRIGRPKVYDLIRTRQLISIKIGRSRRIPAAELAAYLSRRLEESD